ncbi:MAG: AMP-binding protein [Betaproteobacteria bacterium]|nr:AMP-binding protein [Betaproteobacteria bacterium]
MASDRYDEIYRSWQWQVPARFNMGAACCGRYAEDRHRFALYWEDESGATSAHTYWDLQQDANRLSNTLTALGVERGDRVAIILAQRPETVVAHIACYQMGAIAMPLSILFGPDALQYRLQDSGTKVAIVDPASLPNLLPVRRELPTLRHIIGVAGARETDVAEWGTLLAKASRRFTSIDTAAEEAALLVYTSGTTGPPKGALKPHRVILGNLSGFIHSHDLFPQPGDMFWSPADWAWTGGLMDALIPTMYFGLPILGFRGRFDADRAFYLLEKYAVRNTFLFPTALKMMMKAYPEPCARFDLSLRSIMSAGESVGSTVFDWAWQALGVTINEMFGQTEINYIVGNSHTLWPAKSGSMGRPYPGHRVAIIDDQGNELPAGEAGEVAVRRTDIHGVADPVFFLGYWGDAKATEKKFIGDWGCTGDMASRDEDGYLWYQGRTDDVIKSAGYRIGPAEIESCLLQHASVANAAVIGKPDAERTNIVKAFIVLQQGVAGTQELVQTLQAHVRGKLAPYEYPKEIEFVDSLPMTTTGKVQRRILRERGR